MHQGKKLGPGEGFFFEEGIALASQVLTVEEAEILARGPLPGESTILGCQAHHGDPRRSLGFHELTLMSPGVWPWWLATK